MNKLLGSKKAFFIFLLPGIVLFTLILFIPVIRVIYYSLCDYDVVNGYSYVGGNNFSDLMKDDVFWISVKNSVFFMIISAVTQQIVGLAIAAVLMNMKRGKNFFKNVYYLPSVLSSAALGLLWQFIFSDAFGINTLLKKIGIEGPKWLADTSSWIVTPMWVIAFVALWQYVGQTMMLYLAQMTSIPKDIYEAASIDGATKTQTFCRVTLPLLKPMFITTLSFNCLGSLKFFDLIYTMTGGGPNEKTNVLAVMLYNQSFKYSKFAYGSAVAVVLLGISLVVALILNVGIKVDNYEM